MRVFLAILSLTLLSTGALAGPKCDSGPQDKWLTEAAMKAKAVAMGYSINVFKKTSGNCYEIYGKDAAGKRVEVYFNPVTGDPVKH
jgi:hypothetical protein